MTSAQSDAYEPGHSLVSGTAVAANPSLPVWINWSVAMQRRPRLLAIEPDLPAYLLQPEVHRLLSAVWDDHVNLLLDTLWHSGARISEALRITAADFHLNGPHDSDLVLHTAKRRPGRPQKGAPAPKRLVPLADPRYLEKVQRYLATHRPSPQTPLFTFTDRYYRQLLANAVATLPEPLPIPVSLHTLRHSFAVNLIYHGRDIRMIQRLLGHQRLASTLVYTKVLTGEMHHLMQDVAF